MKIDELEHLLNNPRFAEVRHWEDGQVFLLDENGKHQHVAGVMLIPIDGDMENRDVITIVTSEQRYNAIERRRQWERDNG